jgi:cell division protein YceG involved in septum cleavage
VDYFLYNKRVIKKTPYSIEEKGKSRKEHSFENIELFSNESSDDIAYKKLLVKEVLNILDDVERTVFEEKVIEGLTLKQIMEKYARNKDFKITTINKASRIYYSACRKIQEKIS